jgi:hypothetical protein
VAEVLPEQGQPTPVPVPTGIPTGMPTTGVTDDRWTWIALVMGFSGAMMMLGAILRGRSRRQENPGE